MYLDRVAQLKKQRLDKKVIDDVANRLAFLEKIKANQEKTQELVNLLSEFDGYIIEQQMYGKYQLLMRAIETYDGNAVLLDKISYRMPLDSLTHYCNVIVAVFYKDNMYHFKGVNHPPQSFKTTDELMDHVVEVISKL